MIESAAAAGRPQHEHAAGAEQRGPRGRRGGGDGAPTRPRPTAPAPRGSPAARWRLALSRVLTWGLAAGARARPHVPAPTIKAAGEDWMAAAGRSRGRTAGRCPRAPAAPSKCPRAGTGGSGAGPAATSTARAKATAATGDCDGRFECRGWGDDPGDPRRVQLRRLSPGWTSTTSRWSTARTCRCTSRDQDGGRHEGQDQPERLRARQAAPRKSTARGRCDVKAGSAAVGCISACARLGGDQYCCRGQWSSRAACSPAQWPMDYAEVFKSAEPYAYSYVGRRRDQRLHLRRRLRLRDRVRRDPPSIAQRRGSGAEPRAIRGRAGPGRDWVKFASLGRDRFRSPEAAGHDRGVSVRRPRALAPLILACASPRSSSCRSARERRRAQFGSSLAPGPTLTLAATRSRRSTTPPATTASSPTTNRAAARGIRRGSGD